VPHIPLVAFTTFAIAVNFSPGPNNVMSGSLGIMYGYRRTLPFLLGIACGFTLVMIACAAAAALLLDLLPSIEPALKYVGSAYILWLAWVTWVRRASFGKAAEGAVPKSHGFIGGFVLQFANPKVVIYGLMVYSTFLAGISGDVLPLVASAVGLAAISFAAVSTWALAGVTIRRWLRTDRDRAVVAGVLALSLVYTAIELSGVLELL
jgi:cysteine/O-acetylserine efflux protein